MRRTVQIGAFLATLIGFTFGLTLVGFVGSVGASGVTKPSGGLAAVTVNSPLSKSGNTLSCPTCAVSATDSAVTVGVLTLTRSGGSDGVATITDGLGAANGVRVRGGQSGGDGSIDFGTGGSLDTGLKRISAGALKITNASTGLGNLTLSHLVSASASAPTCSAGAALGSGGSPGCTVSGTDAAMYVTVTTGSSGATTGIMTTITFNSAWGAAPKCVLGGAGATGQASVGWGAAVDQASALTTSIQLHAGTALVSGGNTYKFYVHCVE